MITKLNDYILTDNSIDTMRNALDRSRHIKKEIGLTMCLRQDNVITLKGEHEGEDNHVYINRQCNEGEEYVGYYHTHHRGTSKASSWDLASCGTNKISCAGGISEPEIQKGQIDDNVTCYIWKYNVISVQESRQLFADVLKGIEEPHNSRHKSHFNCLNTIGRFASDQKRLDDEYKSIGLDPMRKLPIILKFQRLDKLVDKEVDKYYNRSDTKLRRD